jgi:hypothetical protein
MMTRETATIVSYAWGAIVGAILRESIHKIAALYNNAFTKNSISASMTLGFLVAFFAQGVGLLTGAVAGPTAFASGLVSGTVVFGVSLVISRFIIEVNKEAVTNIVATVKGFSQALWYVLMAKMGRRDVRRDRAREAVRKVG